MGMYKFLNYRIHLNRKIRTKHVILETENNTHLLITWKSVARYETVEKFTCYHSHHGCSRRKRRTIRKINRLLVKGTALVAIRA